MHLENFDNVADAIASRDLIIKDLTSRIDILEEARERHLDLLEQHAKLYDALQARVLELERRPHFVPYPVPQYPPYPMQPLPVWPDGQTCSANSATEPTQQTTGFCRPLGFPY